MIKKNFSKYVLFIVGIILLGILWYVDGSQNRYLEVTVDSDNVSEQIHSWYSEADRTHYLFLPSYVDEDAVTVDEKFARKNKVKVLVSENVPTIFIQTPTGSMNEIYKNKKHKEQIGLVVYDEQGRVVYDGHEVKLKGHGNSSWEQDKKPLKLIFGEETELLGVGEGMEWILQANAFDASNLKNAIVMETAKRLGLKEMSDYSFVDVYINGEYNGLYTLVQSVDDTIRAVAGDREVSMAVSNAEYHTEGNYFKITSKIPAEVKLPEKLPEGCLDKIEALFKQADAVITGESSEPIEEYIDITSWTAKYLIDEIFENSDAGIRSNYFHWYEDGDDKDLIYAGPIWDYDISMGNKGRATENPRALYAAQLMKSRDMDKLWYAYLYNNETFYNAMTKRYADEFSGVLKELVNGGIDEIGKTIGKASFANAIRWNKPDYDTGEALVRWLAERVDFLDSLWVNGDDYVCMTVDYGGNLEYSRYYIRKGDTPENSLCLDSRFGEAEGTSVYSDTGETFDPTKPVYEDFTVNKSQSANESLKIKLQYNFDLLMAVGSFGLIGLIVLIMLIVDVRANGFFRRKN